MAQTTETAATPKSEVLAVLDTLPAEATWDEIEHAIYIRRKIREGQEDARAGRVFTQEEVRQRLRRWLDE
jgi:predicted transcriptional regulator